MSIVQEMSGPVARPRRQLVPLDEAEIGRIDRLRKEIEQLPGLDGPAPESAAEAEWLAYRLRLRQLLASKDPRRFIEWDCIAQSMHVGNPPYIPQELEPLKQSPQWLSRWKPALREDDAGRPPRSQWRQTSSGNLIHHVHHVFRAEPVLGRPLEKFNRIIEFGGGYGSFCRLAWRLGFRGRYVIFDFPEFSALQRYFLRGVGVPLAEAGEANGVHFISDLDELGTEGKNCDLFIGLWSISETPLEFRRQALAAVEPAANFLIASQRQFADVDNGPFFDQWTAEHPQSKWTELPIPYLDARYLIGTAIAAH